MSRILVVEDDETLRVVLRDNLEEEGYTVTEAADGAAALAAIDTRTFDLVVLDIMLPDANGYDLCRQMRQRGVNARVLMLTARTLEDDLVRGLDAGADDYVTKPYRLRELLARCRALLRRQDAIREPELRFGPFRIDVAAREIHREGGRNPRLTRTEFDLLCFFLHTSGRAVSRQEILDKVWGRDVVVDDRTVDNFVSSLKKKLGWKRGAAFTIHTVRGVGYRMELDGSDRG